MGNLRFQKVERLNRKKIMEELFGKGSSFLAFPLKVIFLTNAESHTGVNQVLITAPSKTFKKAVDRNTIKRRIREGYRLSKSLLATPPTFSLTYIYIAKEILPSTIIHKAIRASLERLNNYEKKD